jgi:Fur family zinc uptake transcriptional regulator
MFLICQTCGNVLELSAPAVSDTIGEAAADVDFQADSVTVEVSGVCPRCAEKPGEASHE